MTNNIKPLDPIQGLIDYVLDIKPFHSKIIEVLTEYVSQEAVDVEIRDQAIINIGLNYLYTVPLTECYTPLGGETVVNTIIPVRSNIKFVGSPPVSVYDFNDTIIYINGILQQEVFGSPPTGQYTISGPNQITFITPLNIDDEVKIYTFTQSQNAPNVCEQGGYGTLGYGSPTAITVLSPNAAVPLTAYPAITPNSFIVLGDQRDRFRSTNNILFQIESFVENPITNTNVPDVNNNGTFFVLNSTFTPGSNILSAHTTVTISGLILVPPATPINPSEKYVSLISTGLLPYTKILSYSNAVSQIGVGSPISFTQTPNEGITQLPILNVTAGVAGLVIVEGDFRSSNVFILDTFTIIDSTGNDGTYTITSITYNTLTDETTFGLANLPSAVIDGTFVLNIPSNVFYIDGDYTEFFTQGSGISVTSGTQLGVYTTLNSIFINNQTQIRVIEDIIQNTGVDILTTTATTFVVSGDLTAIYTLGSQFNVVSSLFNDGLYNVSINSTFNGGANETTITVSENINITDTTGSIHEFVGGNLVPLISPGYGQTSIICESVPETIIRIGITDTLNIGYFSAGSPPLAMFQAVIIGTTNTTITVSGDFTAEIINGNTITVIHSSFSPSNDGNYTVSSIPTYNISEDYTTFNVLQPITNIGNSGGWVEGLL